MNKEWEKEQDRISEIQKVLDQKIVDLEKNMGGLKVGIIELRKNFWEDVTVNFDEPDDRGETFTSIKQQVELLAERERTHGQSFKMHDQVIRLKSSPYFGRIDFKEEDENNVDRIYIGIASLMDQNNEQFLIYDWRAPISSLYYDHAPGPAAYMTPSGRIEGEMELKRQFIIKYGELKGMFDTGLTIGDSLLKAVLGGNADAQMKSIVATIQQEQNQIIRNEKSHYLIVQGVAGSGKTSAALQRVAFLLYRYRNTLSSKNIMLFSPNPLFNSYVATVLPELGEENMEQTTYQQYVFTRLGKQYKVEDPFSQMEYTLTAMDEQEYEIRMQSIRFKASLQFKEIIDQYVDHLSNQDLIFKHLSFRGERILSAQKIADYFYSLDHSISIPNRMKLTEEWMLKMIAKREKLEREKDWVHEEVELLDKDAYLEAFRHVESKQYKDATFDDAEREQQYLVKAIVSKHFKPIRQAIKKLKFLNMKAIYSQLFKQKSIFTLPENWDEMCKDTLNQLTSNSLYYEDATPYLYLQDQLEGRKANTLIRHLFIDEAQDYSPFQFEFLRQLFPNCKMTILGDINQAIFAHTMNAPTLLATELDHTEKITLTRSYRSTKQIVDFTKGLIAGGEMIEPFNRDGEEPTFTEVDNVQDLHKSIETCVNAVKEKGHETIAIICKTAAESMEAYDQFKNQLPIHLIDKHTNAYEKGIAILPAYLAKGIEFDAVIIYNASEEQYGREYERKLFYTACTRAMHELHIFSIGRKTPFMNRVE